MNPTTAFVLALAVFLAGLLLPGILGAALLFLLAAGLSGLTFTTWPVQTTSVRAIRLVMLALLFGAVIAKVI
ncbi:DUF6703 family protein [Actinoplanes sp. NPDC051494]|uniref:DUF6703 family protein n=1 Tax=Actinoplanes sp. NPDC051494 TaxID=3363907 RepID=UPI0037AD21AA